MSDTLNAFADETSDINLEELEANLETLTKDELISVCDEINLPDFTDRMKDKTLRKKIREHLGFEQLPEMPTPPKEEKPKTAPAFDFTAGAPSTPLVEADNKIPKQNRFYWVNPFTGNRVAHGQADVDGMVNVDGFAVFENPVNPSDEPEVELNEDGIPVDEL